MNRNGERGTRNQERHEPFSPAFDALPFGGIQCPCAYQDPTRHLTSVLAPLEKRTLVWLAARMPRPINSDHLTVLALVAMLGAGLSYWWACANALGLAAALCLAMNWFGDSLDGTLARVRQRQRPRYGFYVDHVIDNSASRSCIGGMASPVTCTVGRRGLLVAYFMLSRRRSSSPRTSLAPSG